MRILILPCLALLLLSGCSTPTMTRQDLVARMSSSIAYEHSRFFYMGTVGGYDYVLHQWTDSAGNLNESELRFRSGELPVGTPKDFTVETSQWRRFSPLPR